jgi:hypothetical protein
MRGSKRPRERTLHAGQCSPARDGVRLLEQTGRAAGWPGSTSAVSKVPIPDYRLLLAPEGDILTRTAA